MTTVRLPEDWTTQIYDTLMLGNEHPSDCQEDLEGLIKSWAGDIPRTDAGQLAFIVRDLMDAVGYDYQPDRPLSEQARECDQAIRDFREGLTALQIEFAAANNRYEADRRRLTDLVDELRKQVEAQIRRSSPMTRAGQAWASGGAIE